VKVHFVFLRETNRVRVLSERGNAAFVRARKTLWLSTIIASTSLLFPALTPAVQNPSSPQAHSGQSTGPLAEAQLDLVHGDPEGAIRILSDYLQTHSRNAAARTMLGQAYASTGQSDRAEQEFSKVLKSAPDNYIALAALGELYVGENEPEKAEPILARAAKASGGVPEIRTEWAVVLARLHKYKEAQSALAGVSPPNNPDQRIGFHRLKASVALGLGNPSAAAPEMEKALALKPDDPSLALATAATELQSRNWKRAADLAEPVFSQTSNPQAGLICLEAELEEHADFHHTLELLRAEDLPFTEQLAFRQRLAQLLISHGQFPESIEELQAAAQLDPSRADLEFDLALAQYRAGRLDDAAQTAEKCKEVGDTAEIEDLLGDIEEARSDNLTAVKSYQAAVELAPNEEKYRLSLALELIRHSNLDAARVVLKQAEELQPSSWRIELALGMVEFLGGTDDEATRYLMRAAELSPQPKPEFKYLGDVQLARASAPDAAAVAKLCEYSDQTPSDGETQYYCGAVLFRRDYITNNKSHADEILKRLNASVSLLPKNAGAESHCQLGKAYRWLDRWQEALTESKTCARLDPDSADAHYRLAQIYQHMGQPELSAQEMKLHESASMRVADENAQRLATMKTFIYTIQNASPDDKK
jgi:tetratricopeptide (TPR) repeat protein